MSTSSRWLSSTLLAPLVLSGALAGCDSGDESASEGHEGQEGHEDHGHDTDTGEEHGTHGDTGEEANCASEDRDDDFAIGLSKTGDLVQASFVSADPAPPIKGDNSWTVSFADLADEPVEDLEIVVVPMMPDHGHGTPVNAEVAATETPGQYTLSPVNMFMTGYWEVTLELTLAGGETDSVMFGFCVD